jgi:cardiolipin synthase C
MHAGPHSESISPQDVQETASGKRWHEQALVHGGQSGYHLFNAGVDGVAMRVQMIRTAERSLDLQYYIFRGDETGTLIVNELRRAADRGVKVRLLVDDGDTTWGDDIVLSLAGYPNVEVRVFNPFDYRGHHRLWRNVDFLLHKSRLDYRMHNKLLVADNAIALIGGRNIGNQYFQVDPASQFADDDVFVAGPVTQKLSGVFDEFWNSEVVVPAATLRPRVISKPKGTRRIQPQSDYLLRVDSGEPYAGIAVGRTALEWADAKVAYDSPYKREIEAGQRAGSLISGTLEAQIGSVQSELIMMSPYFVPSGTEEALLHQCRSRGAAVRVLSNSLESAPALAAQAGYDKVRQSLLEEGVSLYEVRAHLREYLGSGQSPSISRYGNYALHAKLYVFDRRRLFVGSWNYDQRSLRLNTEIGLLIDDGVLAAQVARRFDDMTIPGEAYMLFLEPGADGKQRVVWQTEEHRRVMVLRKEPSRGWWQRWSVKMLALLPLQPEL